MATNAARVVDELSGLAGGPQPGGGFLLIEGPHVKHSDPAPSFQREDPLAIRAAFYTLARSLGQKPEFRPLPKGWAR